ELFHRGRTKVKRKLGCGRARFRGWNGLDDEKPGGRWPGGSGHSRKCRLERSWPRFTCIGGGGVSDFSGSGAIFFRHARAGERQGGGLGASTKGVVEGRAGEDADDEAVRQEKRGEGDGGGGEEE